MDVLDPADRIAFVREAGPPKGAVTCSDFTGFVGPQRSCFCEGRRYTCPGCLRFVPWCFGASDEAPELCDDCWYILHEAGFVGND